MRTRPPGSSIARPSTSGGRPLSTALVVGAIALVTAGIAAWFLVEEKRIAGDWGYALDDSWIHAVIARNLATGHGFSFNPGEPVAGSSGPLYTCILAFLYLLFHDVIWTAKILGVLCQVGAGVAIYDTARTLLPGRRTLPVVAALLVVTSPSLAWGMLSGMEIPFYLLLVCVGLAFYARERQVLAVLIWSAGVWVRPDGLFLVALGILGPPKEMAKRLLTALPILVGFFGFNFAVGGRWLPQTVEAKAHLGVNLVSRTWNLVQEWGALWGVPYPPLVQVGEPILLLVLLTAGVALTIRRWPLLGLYALGFPLALSLFYNTSANHRRYILYVIPFGMILAVIALDALNRRLPKRWRTDAPVFAGAACLIAQALLLPAEASYYAWSVQNINRMQRTLGTFAKVVTRPGDTLAVNDIGAVGYFSERRVIDLVGLVTPREPLPQMLSKYRPKLIIIFASWFSGFARDDPNSEHLVFFDADSTHRYELVAGVRLERNFACGGNPMTAYVRLDPGDASPERRWLYSF